MNQDIDELDRVVLEAVSRDYEPFESIVGQLSKRGRDALENADIDRVQHRLLTFVADGRVGAWLIHAEPPYITAGGARFETIRSCWFYITEKGMEHLRRLMPLKRGLDCRQPRPPQSRPRHSLGERVPNDL